MISYILIYQLLGYQYLKIVNNLNVQIQECPYLLTPVPQVWSLGISSGRGYQSLKDLMLSEANWKFQGG